MVSAKTLAAVGEVLPKVNQEAKELKSRCRAIERIREKYVSSWSYHNPERSDSVERDYGEDSYKNLQAAKEALFSSYSELKAEIDEGGGYFDSYRNESSIDDDCMRYSSSGLVESEQQIREK